jgi:hypothetical protein
MLNQCSSVLWRSIGYYRKIVSVRLFGQQHEAYGETQFKYEPAISKISGYILVEKVDNQGPLYWGENPPNTPKVGILILVPDRPISVIADTGDQKGIFDQDSFYAVNGLELINPYSKSLDQYVGKHVLVEGKLLERTFGYQYTDVLCLVRQVTLLDSP